MLAGGWAGCQSTAPHVANAPVAIQPSDAHYAFLFGHQYRTKVDLYLFGFTQQGEPVYYLGTRADNLDLGPKQLPARISRENIGKVYEAQPENGPGDVIIMDVVPAGAVLTIRAETHEVTPLSGVRGSGGYPMGFICDVNYDHKTNAVLAEFVQSHKQVSGKAPNQDISDAVAEKIQ
jgi:hypothetical protein